jgi:hypothetical protein
MTRRVVMCILLALASVSTLSTAQQKSTKLSNPDVIEMVGMGLSDDVILDKIHSAEATEFDTGLEALKTLKASKVSDAVLRAMINPHAVAATGTSTPTPSLSSGTGGLPDEVGVYAVIKGKLSEVEPEVVGWQTGGKLKSMATMGLDKGHVNGKVSNPKSPLQVTNPIEFLIKTPEGTSVTEYQLLRLDVKDNRREFRAMTGGIIHASGGAERNAMPFQPEKVGTRIWRISPKDLKRGEYGFLPPGMNSASISSSGKMYTFGLTE